MIQAKIIGTGFIKIVFLGVKFLGDALKIVRLDLNLHNICSSFLTRACWLLLTYMLTYLLDLKDMVSFIFLLCFIWGIYKSFINSKNLHEFITRFIANRLNNIIDIILFNTILWTSMNVAKLQHYSDANQKNVHRKNLQKILKIRFLSIFKNFEVTIQNVLFLFCSIQYIKYK